MLTDWVFDRIEAENLNDIWYEQDVTTRKLTSEKILGALSSKIKYLVEIVMWIGQEEDVIWRRWTILFGERWKISVNQQSRNAIADKRSVTGKNSVDQMGYCKVSRDGHFTDSVLRL